MLKVRVISAIIGMALLITVAMFGHITLSIAVFLLAVIGIREFYNAFSSAGYKPVRTLGYISCLPIIFMGVNGGYKTIQGYFMLFKSINYFSLLIFITLLILFSCIVFLHDKIDIIDISVTVFGMLYVTFLFAFVVLTRNIENGNYYIWLIFIGAFATDTFAYFSGMLFGKNKLLPAISPKKTVEGSIGGILGCVILTILFGIFINYNFSRNNIVNIQIYHFLILGILSGIVSQIGDLSASSIKRYVNIKDFGKIMPGHGGVLDRFDSILFIAPLVYFYISFVVI